MQHREEIGARVGALAEIDDDADVSGTDRAVEKTREVGRRDRASGRRRPPPTRGSAGWWLTSNTASLVPARAGETCETLPRRQRRRREPAGARPSSSSSGRGCCAPWLPRRAGRACGPAGSCGDSGYRPVGPTRCPRGTASTDSLASPFRARSLFTVRAAISSAVSSDSPRSRAESLMCSYWRARFVPFSTPRGGMARLSSVDFAVPRRRTRAPVRETSRVEVSAVAASGNSGVWPDDERRGDVHRWWSACADRDHRVADLAALVDRVDLRGLGASVFSSVTVVPVRALRDVDARRRARP